MDRADQGRLRRLDGTLLLVFRELLRQGRATGAAERLGLSQSGVSHALARLREVFEDPLFTRRPHGLEPTRRALELAPAIERLLALAEEAVGGRRTYAPAASRRAFRIGAAEHLIPLIAPPLLARLARQSPQASMAFQHAIGRGALLAVSRGEIDVAVGMFQPREGLAHELLLQADYALVLRRGHPALAAGIDLAAFAELGHVLVAPDGRPVEVAARALAEAGVRRRVVATAPRFLTAFAIVASTDLALVAPRPLARRFAQGFGLAVVDTPFAPIAMRVLAVYRLPPPADPGLDWLLAELRAAVAPEEQ